MTTGAAEELQRVFKTLADPTRVRILRLLEQQELIVGEMMDILGMAQSRVSRHLAILREAGLLSDRRDGTFVAYRLVLPDDGPWRDAWVLARESLAEDPTAAKDDMLLAKTLATRKARAISGRSFFDEVGPEWDALRTVFGDELLRARATAMLVQPHLRVADIGTGTGVLALELAELGLDVIAVDQSAGMLDAAREKWSAVADQSLGRVEFCDGDAHALPIEDESVDAAFAHMVLHSLAEPERAIAEMFRVVRPGGQLVLVDFLDHDHAWHDHAWMEQELGLVWLGFDPAMLREWIEAAGFETPRIQSHPADASNTSGTAKGSTKGNLKGKADLPESFVASARKPTPA